jgi:hypothetical protein
MRVINATLVLGGVLLLATASLRFDVIQIKPRNGQPYIVKKIVWPWERKDICVLQADGSYERTRFSFWGLRSETTYGGRRSSAGHRAVCGARTPGPVAEPSDAADSQ